MCHLPLVRRDRAPHLCVSVTGPRLDAADAPVRACPWPAEGGRDAPGRGFGRGPGVRLCDGRLFVRARGAGLRIGRCPARARRSAHDALPDPGRGPGQGRGRRPVRDAAGPGGPLEPRRPPDRPACRGRPGAGRGAAARSAVRHRRRPGDAGTQFFAWLPAHYAERPCHPRHRARRPARDGCLERSHPAAATGYVGIVGAPRPTAPRGLDA